MKRWKDGRNRYELYLDSCEKEGVLYHEEDDVYYFRTFINGNSNEVILRSNTLADAKTQAEKWLIKRYKEQRDMHERCITFYKEKMTVLEQEG